MDNIRRIIKEIKVSFALDSEGGERHRFPGIRNMLKLHTGKLFLEGPRSCRIPSNIPRKSCLKFFERHRKHNPYLIGLVFSIFPFKLETLKSELFLYLLLKSYKVTN